MVNLSLEQSQQLQYIVQDEGALTLQQILSTREIDNLHQELNEDIDQAVADNIAYASMERHRPKLERCEALSPSIKH